MAKRAPKPPTLTAEQRLLCTQLEPLTRDGRFLVLPEHRFHPVRRHRIDVALNERIGDGFYGPALAVEIDGGGFIGGRHSRGLGLEADCEKSALLAAAGYRLVRVTPKQVRTGQALAWIQECL